jgi:uncharacterized protein (TIGR00290 family)
MHRRDHSRMPSTREPIVLSWSGGKDSALALAALRDDPAVEVVALLTSITGEYDRISIHGVRRSLLETQVQALGLPLHEISLTPHSSNDAYESALERALTGVRRAYPAVRRIAYGDLFLEDVRRYREDRLAAIGYGCCFPLWDRPTPELAEEFISRGFAARLVCVDTTLLDARFAGRPFDRALLDELPCTVDPCGERGEFHTFVSAGPGFSSAIAYTVGEVVLRDARFAYCDLLNGTERSAGPAVGP